MALSQKHMQRVYIFAFAISVIMFIYSFIISTVDPSGPPAQLSYEGRIDWFFAYFSIQANLICTVIFGAFIFEHRFLKLSFHFRFLIRLSSLVFIVISGLFFLFGLKYETDLKNQYNTYTWIGTIWLHILLPILTTVVFCLAAGRSYYDVHRHHAGPLWLITGYLWTYFVIILIRGFIRNVDKNPTDTLFPYFFIDYYQKNVLYIALIILSILVVSVVLQYFFIFLNNWILFRRYSINFHNYVSHIVLKRHQLNPSVGMSKRLKIGLCLAVIYAVLEVIASIVLIVLNGVFENFLKVYGLETITNIFFYIFTALVILIDIIIILTAIWTIVWKNYTTQLICASLSLVSAALNWFTIVGPILSLMASLVIFSSEENKLHEFRINLINTKIKNYKSSVIVGDVASMKTEPKQIVIHQKSWLARWKSKRFQRQEQNEPNPKDPKDDM